MSSSHVDPSPSEPTGEELTPRPLVHRSRIWIAAIAAGLMAGFLGWLFGEPIHARFAPPKFVNTASSTGGFKSPSEVYQLDMAKRRAQILDACLVFGAFGMALGGALGLAGSRARTTSPVAVWNPAIFGLFLGGIAAAAASALALPVYYWVHDPDTNDLLVGLLLHVVISAAIGAAGGAAFGVGLGHRDAIARGAFGGLLGACVGAVVYEILGAIAFALDETSSPISATWSTRLLGRLLVTIFASAGAAFGILDRKPESGPATEAPPQSA